MSPKTIYSEVFSPWFLPLVFFLPPFYRYGIVIKKDEGQDGTITFGYGMTGPGGLTAHTSSLRDIDPSSVVVGDASTRDNLAKFGGYGIRYGRGGIWAYNAIDGPYCEFEEKKPGSSRSTKYRIVSKNVEEVASLLRGEESSNLTEAAHKQD